MNPLFSLFPQHVHVRRGRIFWLCIVLVVSIEWSFPQAAVAHPIDGEPHTVREARSFVAIGVVSPSERLVSVEVVEKAPSVVKPAQRILYSVPITAYSSTPDQTDDSPFITASATFVRDGVVAANFLPIGTRVRIPQYFGDKIFVVEDRMNTRYWYRIDIWMPDRASAKQWGLRHVMVEVL